MAAAAEVAFVFLLAAPLRVVVADADDEEAALDPFVRAPFFAAAAAVVE